MRVIESFLWCLLLLWPAVVLVAPAHPALHEIDPEQPPQVRQRGAEMVVGLCMSCHDLKYLRYRDLLEIGFSRERVDVLRGPREMEDRLLSLTSAEQRRQLFGLVPPDLSLIAKARRGGASYVYTLLTSFYTTPEGTVDNRLFPGIRMPDALGSSSAGNREAVAETALAVASFLHWAADPRAEERHRLGYYVLGYLALLTFLLYLNKRRIWRRLDRPTPEPAPESTPPESTPEPR